MWALRKQLSAETAASIAAALVATAVTVLYAYVIAHQGHDAGRRPWLIGASLLTASLLLLASTVFPKAPARLLLMSSASFTLVIWTVVGAFSIGVLLLPAALLALYATGRATPSVSTAVVWPVLIVAAAGSLLAVTVVLESS
jgi:hypothetical protein